MNSCEKCIHQNKKWNNDPCYRCGFENNYAWCEDEYGNFLNMKMKEQELPQVNQKVKIGDRFGIITEVTEPNEYHSGRFRVDIHEKNRVHNEEFWFSDYGTSVVKV